ncbi:MAG: AAA family ATPase, partial [Candidatus Humimicrobiaceae bacterium]
IKVVIEVRRCGKSVLSHHLLKDKNYAYINFDDERLISVKAEDLNDFPFTTFFRTKPAYSIFFL